MQELKERIVKEGKVLPGNIIKVDGFLNHRIDTGLLTRIAEEFGKYFNMDEVTMVLTAEASGIALATAVATYFHKPMIFAKKAKSDNIEGGLYQSDIYSYTYKKKVTLLVSKEWLSAGGGRPAGYRQLRRHCHGHRRGDGKGRKALPSGEYPHRQPKR